MPPVRDLEIGRVVRALRHRHGWRQEDLARRAGVSQRHVSRFESGDLDHLTLHAVRAMARPLGLDIALLGRWRGGELDRLLDADHAFLQSAFRMLLDRLGWLVAAEVTFNERGERGSMDLLAMHPPTGMLLVVEIKTMVADVQGLLRPLDAKVRLASVVARRLGWHARVVVPCLVLAESTTTRRRLREHAPLFAPFARRGVEARRWLASPSSAPPRRLLLLRKLPPSRGASVRRAGRQRVRLARSRTSVATGPDTSRPPPVAVQETPWG